jgi:hypothetical protein
MKLKKQGRKFETFFLALPYIFLLNARYAIAAAI